MTDARRRGGLGVEIMRAGNGCHRALAPAPSSPAPGLASHRGLLAALAAVGLVIGAAGAGAQALFSPETAADLYRGVTRLRSPESPYEFPGDNTGRWGMTYTKPTNLAMDLISTLVAERSGLEPAAAARRHIGRLVDGLEALETHAGVFPEFVRLEDGRVRAERQAGTIVYSALDSAWLHFALSLAEARYKHDDAPLASRVRAMLDLADYSIFVDASFSFKHNVVVDATSRRRRSRSPFGYDNANSEARVTILYLVATGRLSPAAWERVWFRWRSKERERVAEGWRWNAFAELTGNVFFDELTLAPRSFGASHRGYLAAARRVTDRAGLELIGWGPSATPANEDPEGYSDAYGLDRPEVATPYAAALLTTVEQTPATAARSLTQMLRSAGNLSAPVPDAYDSRTGEVVNRRARSLNQNLLFLALNLAQTRAVVARAPWYDRAAALLRTFDRRHALPSGPSR